MGELAILLEQVAAETDPAKKLALFEKLQRAMKSLPSGQQELLKSRAALRQLLATERETYGEYAVL